ncbi:MAG TPA: hypothetical protein VFU14_20275 [Acidimicrobiales bacterium]|nr:hypothetical protein [Acidimicrobiales bacterium]
MTPAELVPGQFVRLRATPPSMFTGERFIFARYVGHFEGDPIVEDANGTRAIVRPSELAPVPFEVAS